MSDKFHMEKDALRRLLRTYEAGRVGDNGLAILYPADVGQPVFLVTRAQSWMTDYMAADFDAFLMKANNATPEETAAALMAKADACREKAESILREIEERKGV